MQFAADGYLVEGDDIELTGPQAVIRVGDGTMDGAGYVATVASNLTGNSGLVKADLGTLVLSGTNTYTGGTAINGGTLRIASDLNLGDAAGALAKDGAGTLVLASDATHAGGTTITAGTLRVGDGATAGSLVGDLTNNGTLEFSRSDDITFGGAISATAGRPCRELARWRPRRLLPAAPSPPPGSPHSASTVPMRRRGERPIRSRWTRAPLPPAASPSPGARPWPMARSST
jgi:autotransporter-associated beta strand protein